VVDHTARFPEAIDYLSALMRQGKLKHGETVITGLESARDALNRMFDGSNTGKLLVKVAERSTGLNAPAAAA
jgi:NADPH-dependent curcumin reductase CurA